jgi:light-regulated signal transduction histidine kinase (bacteriophytochrome)
LAYSGTYSPRVMDWFGFTEPAQEMKAIFGAIHPDDQESVMAAIHHSTSSEAVSRHDVTYRVMHPGTGTVQYLRSIGKAFFDPDGRAYEIRGIIQDVTPQVQYRKRIEENEALLQQRVDERTGELESLNSELKRSNDNLEEFAYAASHDLKEPIRKINFFASRLKRELAATLSEEQARLFDRMERSALRMSTLIDDLLTFSHISKEASKAEPVDLNAKMQAVLEDLELEIAEKGATITVDPLPTIKGHERQVQQLFQNLVGNALKYSKPGTPPEVRIRYKEVSGAEAPVSLPENGSNRYHLVEISDNGIGFKQEDATRIFNVFTRLHGNAEYKGSGVGLSIARKVAENHGGCITAESVPGEGATFRVLLSDG